MKSTEENIICTIANQSIILHIAQVQFSSKVSKFTHFIQRAFRICTPKQLNNRIDKIYCKKQWI